MPWSHCIMIRAETCAPNEDWDQPAQLLGTFWKAKDATMNKIRGSAGWFESSFSAHVRKNVFFRCGSLNDLWFQRVCLFRTAVCKNMSISMQLDEWYVTIVWKRQYVICEQCRTRSACASVQVLLLSSKCSILSNDSDMKDSNQSPSSISISNYRQLNKILC